MMLQLAGFARKLTKLQAREVCRRDQNTFALAHRSNGCTGASRAKL